VVVPQVPCGGIWPFGDLTTGAHQLALVLVPCQAAELTPANLRSATPRARVDGKNRCTTGAPRDRRVGGDLGEKLWTLAVSHHRLWRSPPHMNVPASAVRSVFSGALINVQSLESVAFSSLFFQLAPGCNWLAGAPW
jgi:hypothetical protein